MVIDVDNGSEFVNETMIQYCLRNGIELTRSRPYRKNDQAWIEQKTGAIVRKLLGYRRFEGIAAAQALARLYGASRLFVNFFQPSFKLAEKHRQGAQVTKRYHPPQTPSERLLLDDSAWFHCPGVQPLRGIDVHIPPGFTTVFPYVFATDARSYLAFLVQGLGGEVLNVLASPEGVVRNAHVRFGDTTIMVSEARGSFEPSRGTYYLYVEDADAAMARAVAAGGRSLGPVADTPYNDRQGGVADPSGNIWWLSQRLIPGPY